jgi:hypothetical protein
VYARVVWAIFGSVLLLTVVTYWRLAPGATYHFDDGGVSGAVSRSLTYLNFPVAVAAVGVLLVVGRGWPALAAGLLCLVAVWPGVSSEDALTARWVNAPAVLGVAIAVAATWRTSGSRVDLGRARLVLLALLAAWSIPWLVAAAGFYASDVPLLGHLFRSSEPTPGQPALASVHRGLHEGLLGAQLAAAALILSARRPRWPRQRFAAAYLALMFVYGVAVSARDGWDEQVVKRGWSSAELPDVLHPAPTLAWGTLIAAAAIIYHFWLRRPPRRRAT